MLSAKEAAIALGISEQRVRKMLASGQLEGKKLGRSWMVSEQSVQARKVSKPHAGRPSHNGNQSFPTTPEVESAHKLFDDAQRTFQGCFSGPFLDLARSPEEQEFWIKTADFFLQQRQRELIAQGVY